MTEKKHQKQVTSLKLSPFRKIVLSVVLLIALLLIALSILSRQDSVQEWYGHKIAQYLSSKTGFPIEMGITEASLFRGIVVHNLFIADQNGQDMIRATEIETSLRKNLFSLVFQNQVNLEDIKIIDAQVDIRQLPGEKESNLKLFLKSFGNSDKSKNDCQDFFIKQVKLENVAWNQHTMPKQNLRAEIKKARIQFNKFDLCSNLIDIRELLLESGSLAILLEEGYIPNAKSSSSETDTMPHDTLQVIVSHLVADNCAFSYINEEKKKSEFTTGIDFNALDLEKIALEIRDFTFNSVFESGFEIEQLSFLDKSGFKLDRLSVEDGRMNQSEIVLNDVILETPGSLIRHNLSLSYRDFSDFSGFADRVRLDISLDDCEILPSDIFYFAAPLANNQFFKENKNELIRLDGQLTGRVNAFKGKNVHVILQDNSYLEGSFSSRNLTIPGEQLMNIRLNEFKSNTETIAKLLPAISFTQTFHRLGNLNFRGSFDGYFHDFVAFGELATDIGDMQMDMRLDLTDGASLAQYSGNFGLMDFSLGKFSDNPDLGNISLNAQVIDGQGLNINTVNADLFARVDSLEFKKHTYRNLVMDGYLDKNLFNGDFSINEEYIKLDISGIINYGDSIPLYQFDTNISHIDLEKLNLTPNPLQLSSKVNLNLEGSNLNNISGKLVAKQLTLTNTKKSIKLDSVLISSQMSGKDERYIDLSSQILSFYFDGVYQLNKIPDAIIDLLRLNHPELMQTVPYVKNTVNNPGYHYDFYMYIPDSKDFFEIVQPIPAQFKDMVVSGHLDHRESYIDINSTIASLELADLELRNFAINLDLKDDSGNIRLNSQNIRLGNTSSDSLFFNADIAKNTINYTIKLDTLDENLNQVNLAAMTKPHEKGFETTILNGNFEFFDENWYVSNDNKIVLGDKYIALENFSLVNGLNTLKLDDINQNQGLKTVISGFDVDILNSFLEIEMLKFSGSSEGFVLMPDIFESRLFEGALRVKELNINGDPYGQLTTLVKLNPIQDNSLQFSGTLTNNEHNADVKGVYDLKNKFLDLGIDAQRFPIAFLEYIIQEGISGTEGIATGHVSFQGPKGNVQIEGQARAYDVKTTINYLGTTYYANDQLVNISTNYIDFTGIQLNDMTGNTALVKGGLKHTLFKDLVLDLNIQSERITGLNTTREMNPLYYGKAIGSANVRFSGPLEKGVISLDAQVFQGSNLTIPVRSQTEVSQTSFIKFTNGSSKTEKDRQITRTELTGLDLDMNLSILPGAEVQIVLDETAGDNIRGTGTGDIRLEITRAGGFEMYGNFYIDQGTYLFTALTLIQKPFTIRQGGKITWTGDPLDANIDLLADYKGERVALDNFIREYTINNDLLAQQARKRTDVELLLHLTGSLLHPSVSFDLNFPNLDGDIKSYVFSKLQKLRSDQNLMYTQAVALLSLGAFLPQDNLSGLESNVSTAATGLHTGLQYSAVLLSKYLSGLFEELFAESSWISGVDIDINVINSQALGLEQDNIWPNEYTYDARLHLFEDKASIEFSGSYVNRGIIDETRSYANGDFIFKYYFTEDRKLLIEAYSKREFDEFLREWKWKIGTGVNYQMQFGSIYDMKKDVEADLQSTSPLILN